VKVEKKVLRTEDNFHSQFPRKESSEFFGLLGALHVTAHKN
jgi:hypothetical protein